VPPGWPPGTLTPEATQKALAEEAARKAAVEEAARKGLVKDIATRLRREEAEREEARRRAILAGAHWLKPWATKAEAEEALWKIAAEKAAAAAEEAARKTTAERAALLEELDRRARKAAAEKAAVEKATAEEAARESAREAAAASPTWTGFSTGVNAGGTWSSNNAVDVSTATAFNGPPPRRLASPVGRPASPHRLLEQSAIFP
jgi:trimeric autotransporter adhesin